MRIALLSNVTVEVLAGMLGDEHAVWTPSGFGAWMEVALAPPQEMKDFDPDVVCVLLDARFGDVDESVQSRAAAASALASSFPRATVSVPDPATLLADLGDAAYDERMWKLARMPWSMEALLELKKLFSPEKKVLALDLDNTLWRGVVSEDGVAGIAPDVALQREAKALKDRGVLLVALSMNDAEDVAPVWRDPRMVLREDDFVAMRIDWRAKSGNLADVARELNLSPDSFVFVDDNAGNRAEMRSALPEVAVAAFPPDLSVYFPRRPATEEDGARTERYRADARRRELASRLALDDYLAALEIRTEVRPMAADEIPRVAQLAQRSNQVNVCTNRWTEDEIRRFAADPSRRFFTLRAADRFGDQGLVAFVHVVVEGRKGDIVDWVMSCRAMNRRIEFALEGELERRLAGEGVRTLRAVWRRTSKNGPSADLFDRLGFASGGATDAEKSYVKEIAPS